MQFHRSSGILLHPTSFPGPDGIGDLGSEAYRFVDWLAMANQELWQILPIGPAGPGNSPYASPSAFAGNPLLVSLDLLEEAGLLSSAERSQDKPQFSDYEVLFDEVSIYKTAQMRKAFDHFRESASVEAINRLEAFAAAESGWLNDYALYMALKEQYDGRSWTEWPSKLRDREPDALNQASLDSADEIGFHRWVQFVVREQWTHLKTYANERGIQIVGDIPIYVAFDSADVWSNQQLFRLGNGDRPAAIAGVPPDLFTDDGQLWGNPLFDWKAMKDDNYAWWRLRVSETLELVDIIRIDHFRGFAAGWSVPIDAETGRSGRWERGPGREVFDAIWDGVGDVPFFVEDLGLITPDVNALRLDLDLPGIKVLQFAFGGDSQNPYLPHNYTRHCVVYPGTHDNQTTIGWFETLDEVSRRKVQQYLGRDGADVAWDFIRLALESVANVAIVTLQDVMRLGDEARMNTPGVGEGNWSWRYLDHQLHEGIAIGLAELSTVYGRNLEIASDTGHDPYDYTAPGTAHSLHEASEPFSG